MWRSDPQTIDLQETPHPKVASFVRATQLHKWRHACTMVDANLNVYKSIIYNLFVHFQSLHNSAQFCTIAPARVRSNLSGSGLRATGGREPRQVRKEATVVISPVCRGLPGAWQARLTHVSGHRQKI